VAAAAPRVENPETLIVAADVTSPRDVVAKVEIPVTLKRPKSAP